MELIAKIICLANQPFQNIKNTGFKALINFYEPQYTLPSRKTLSNVFIPRIYKKNVAIIKKRLENIISYQFISLTTDM